VRTETLTRTLFAYEELAAPAQEKARDWYREGFDYPWATENRDSLAAFCQVFPVVARDWSYDAGAAHIVPVFTGEDGLAGLSGVRLLAYLENHYNRPRIPLPVFHRRRCFKGKGRKRLSRILMEDTCCPFTGYHLDEVLLGPLRQFLRRPDGRCFTELLSDCLWAWVRACRDDWTALLEDEAVEETIVANGWEFTGDGVWAGACFRWPATA
jgi:hypothetical protein